MIVLSTFRKSTFWECILLCTAGYELAGSGRQVVRNGGAFEAKELWRVTGDKEVASLGGAHRCKRTVFSMARSAWSASAPAR